jgi:hypothetical protein
MGKVDPNKVVSSCRVIAGNVNARIKKEADQVESYLRIISSNMQSGNRGETLAAARKYGECRRRQEFWEKLSNAVRTIQDNAGTLVSSATPRPELEEPLRMIVGNAEPMKLTEFVTFKNTVLKEVYSTQVISDLSNPAKMPRQATLENSNFSERDLILMVKDVADRLGRAADFAKMFPVIPAAPASVSSTPAPVSAVTSSAKPGRTQPVQQPPPTPVQKPAPQPTVKVQSAEPTKIVYRPRGPDLNLVNIPAFPKEKWPRLAQQVREALA